MKRAVNTCVMCWACVAISAAVGCRKPSERSTAAQTSTVATVPDAIARPDAGAADAGATDAAPDADIDTPSPAPSPAERARALLEKQVALLPAGDAALAGMFAKDAVVLTPVAWPLDDMTIHDPSIHLAAAVARMTPHASLRRKKLNMVVAGGNAEMVWLAGELEVTTTSREVGEPKSIKKQHVVRTLQLIDAAANWKVVAASFGDVKPLDEANVFFPIPAPTAAGPLSKLLVSPSDVATSLADDPAVVVQGPAPGEYAEGPAGAKALLAKWSKRKLEINKDTGVHEVHGKHWGYALANVRYSKGDTTYQMSALVLAVSTGTAWSVVALHYLPL